MINTKQFQILTDIELVYKLMTEVYNHEQTNGPVAPFFEYAITSPWMDMDFLRLNRFWLEDGSPVAFVFYEQPVTSLYFVLRPGYENLAGAMAAAKKEEKHPDNLTAYNKKILDSYWELAGGGEE